VKYGKGEGVQYVDFLVQTLKPFIDKKYRTLKDSSHTYIAGSSLGGLISMYAAAKYPNVFGGAGIFSPSFWIAPKIFEETANANWGNSFRRFFFYGGGREDGAMVPDMDKMLNTIEKKGRYKTRRVMNPLGKHNEATWRKEFGGFYDFIVN
jgi:predicted alpha/beta superfamily hydrolase